MEALRHLDIGFLFEFNDNVTKASIHTVQTFANGFVLVRTKKLITKVISAYIVLPSSE